MCKKYRVKYWLGSDIVNCYFYGNCMDDVEEDFRSENGDKKIICIEEIEVVD